jgi:hypothetical protein
VADEEPIKDLPGGFSFCDFVEADLRLFQRRTVEKNIGTKATCVPFGETSRLPASIGRVVTAWPRPSIRIFQTCEIPVRDDRRPLAAGQPSRVESSRGGWSTAAGRSVGLGAAADPTGSGWRQVGPGCRQDDPTAVGRNLRTTEPINSDQVLYGKGCDWAMHKTAEPITRINKQRIRMETSRLCTIAFNHLESL